MDRRRFLDAALWVARVRRVACGPRPVGIGGPRAPTGLPPPRLRGPAELLALEGHVATISWDPVPGEVYTVERNGRSRPVATARALRPRLRQRGSGTDRGGQLHPGRRECRAASHPGVTRSPCASSRWVACGPAGSTSRRTGRSSARWPTAGRRSTSVLPTRRGAARAPGRIGRLVDRAVLPPADPAAVRRVLAAGHGPPPRWGRTDR